ncbi:hypothetical protein GCM10017782_26180 [Deinococcus ficus]|nr:hypothetical protein GCM10017782_26180 [Deinococcus ficus]
MSRGRHSPVPQPTPEERALLEALVRRRQTPRGLATRARVILLSTDHPEWTLSDIGEKVGLSVHPAPSRSCVCTWKRQPNRTFTFCWTRCVRLEAGDNSAELG